MKNFEVATGIIGEYGWFTPDQIADDVAPYNVRERLAESQIYVCRARIGYNGDFHPGKTRRGDFETCFIGYGHKEREEPTYQILGCFKAAIVPPPVTDPPCDNDNCE